MEQLISEAIARGHDGFLYEGRMPDVVWEALTRGGYRLTSKLKGTHISWYYAEKDAEQTGVTRSP